jgi:hypothetical protein
VREIFTAFTRPMSTMGVVDTRAPGLSTMAIVDGA